MFQVPMCLLACRIAIYAKDILVVHKLYRPDRLIVCEWNGSRFFFLFVFIQKHIQSLEIMQPFS